MQRIILLGASNLTVNFPLIVGSVRRSLDRPVEILAAHGHGRSFGMRSRVLGRILPGITQSGLWDDLAARPRPAMAPWALITDVGNDLLYGASVDVIARWVETCLTQLRRQEAHITLVTLPMASVLRLGQLRYASVKAFFFPGKGPNWADMRRMALDLDSAMKDLGAQFNARIVEPSGDWYGFDPIHIRRGLRPRVWQTMLSHWPHSTEWQMTRAGWRGSLGIWRLRPAERTLWGRAQSARQPCAVWDDGGSLSLY